MPAAPPRLASPPSITAHLTQTRKEAPHARRNRWGKEHGRFAAGAQPAGEGDEDPPDLAGAVGRRPFSGVERPRVAGIARWPVALGGRSGRSGDGERSMGEAAHGHGVHFLDACFLCRRPLAGNRDIFMYRGDTAFCTEECRSAQMAADEAAERKGRASSAKAVVTRGPLPAREAPEGPQERGKVRAGSILAL